MPAPAPLGSPVSDSVNVRDVHRVIDAVAHVLLPAGQVGARLDDAAAHIGELCGAPCIAFGRVTFDTYADKWRIVSATTVGQWEEADRASFIRYTQWEDADSDPLFDGMAALARTPSRRDTPLAMRRQDVVSDQRWYASRNFNELRRPHGFDHCAYGMIASKTSGDDIFVIGLHRRIDQPEFQPRERKLLELFIGGVSPIVHPAPEVMGDALRWNLLTPRLRSVALELLAGHSVKQAAARLNLKEDTVRTYTRDLHERLCVASRGELLARYFDIARQQPSI
jgi:DNA-binding CsgD family transcriptional regulator